ncbi:hypothetical protein L2E82_01107 [Cichorium intybus]|uniref:Uncharacterized protein n=1 Tax=Cichorium intybus TaxID=13427 RepID=A0ACB9GZF4_CICIN|nr:hypothetical protein L2E82_01107 [Cichorium intybus]
MGARLEALFLPASHFVLCSRENLVVVGMQDVAMLWGLDVVNFSNKDSSFMEVFLDLVAIKELADDI